MKSYIKFFGIITLAVVIGFSFLSCEEDLPFVEPSSGELIIRGLSEFNGKNVIAYGYIYNENSTRPDKYDPAFIAGSALKAEGEKVNITYATVTNSNVTLKVWVTSDFNKFYAFDKPTQNVLFRVICLETRNELRKTDPDAWGVIGEVKDVDFQGGGKADENFTKGAAPDYPY